MEEMKRIVWLASYPKSGNTWFRVFLENYRRNAEVPADINALEASYGPGARFPFDEATGLESGELSWDEIDQLRPEAYLLRARRHTGDGPLFCKVHDAYSYLPDGRPLFPVEATLGAIYFIRNPLDVCVSYAHHSGLEDLDQVIRSMADPERIAMPNREGLALQLTQRFLTWSGHVCSWVDAAGVRVRVLRYEDMKLRTKETFTAAVRFLGWPDEPERLRRALSQSSFAEMQRQERASGFRERTPEAESFFRKGEIGSWRERLTPAQAARIVADHGEVMRRFGYLTAEGEIVF